MGSTGITNPLEVADCTQKVASPLAKCNQRFSQQIKLLSIENKVSVTGVPYVFIFEGEQKDEDGSTDSQGKTKRVFTKAPEKVCGLKGKLASSYLKRENAFGSLKDVEKRKTNIITTGNYPVEEVPYTSGYDYITVVGARTAPWDPRLTRRGVALVESMGNQYRFINCGLRQLQMFPVASRYDHAVQRVMVVFKQGYTSADIARINEYTQNFGARIVYVGNVAEFIEFLNAREAKRRLIKKLVLYCHGIINNASFHYAGDDESGGLFGVAKIPEVKELVFDYDALVTTYACRAGISVDGKNLSGRDAGQKNSPAQKMANSWDILVNAFEMRTDYTTAYGTGTETDQVKAYRATIDSYTQALRAYHMEVAAGNKDAKPPQKPANYDEMLRQYENVTTRERNESKGNGPIAPYGITHLPVTGDTPTGLKKGLQEYKPQEWKN